MKSQDFLNQNTIPPQNGNGLYDRIEDLVDNPSNIVDYSPINFNIIKAAITERFDLNEIIRILINDASEFALRQNQSAEIVRINIPPFLQQFLKRIPNFANISNIYIAFTYETLERIMSSTKFDKGGSIALMAVFLGGNNLAMERVTSGQKANDGRWEELAEVTDPLFSREHIELLKSKVSNQLNQRYNNLPFDMSTQELKGVIAALVFELMFGESPEPDFIKNFIINFEDFIKEVSQALFKVILANEQGQEMVMSSQQVDKLKETSLNLYNELINNLEIHSGSMLDLISKSEIMQENNNDIATVMGFLEAATKTLTNNIMHALKEIAEDLVKSKISGEVSILNKIQKLRTEDPANYKILLRNIIRESARHMPTVDLTFRIHQPTGSMVILGIDAALKHGFRNQPDANIFNPWRNFGKYANLPWMAFKGIKVPRSCPGMGFAHEIGSSVLDWVFSNYDAISIIENDGKKADATIQENVQLRFIKSNLEG